MANLYATFISRHKSHSDGRAIFCVCVTEGAATMDVHRELIYGRGKGQQKGALGVVGTEPMSGGEWLAQNGLPSVAIIPV